MMTTRRCILRKPVEDDCPNLIELYSNAEVRKYLGGPADIQALMKRMAAMIDSGKGLYWIITTLPDSAFIGSVSLDLHRNGADTEISYQLLPKWWRNGYGTEVVQRVIRYAFEDLGLQKLVAETQTANAGSCKLLTRLGMRAEQTLSRFGAEQTIFSISHPLEDGTRHGLNEEVAE